MRVMITYVILPSTRRPHRRFTISPLNSNGPNDRGGNGRMDASSTFEVMEGQRLS